MAQTWNDLLFAHWPIAPDLLRPLVPTQLPLDTYDGTAWVAIAPFHMSGIHARAVPQIPGLAAFPELNVRTYVTLDGKPGVFFFSLDITSTVAVWAARTFYKLPYFHASMAVAVNDKEVRYSSKRMHPGAELRGRYAPIAPVKFRDPGTLEHFLTERYCLYTVAERRVYRAEVHHHPWPLQDAEAQFEINTMADAAGVTLPQTSPLYHFARRLEVLIWPLQRIR
jgi:uncharacterized protein YqjF (DUF2071 family)